MDSHNPEPTCLNADSFLSLKAVFKDFFFQILKTAGMDSYGCAVVSGINDGVEKLSLWKIFKTQVQY